MMLSLFASMMMISTADAQMPDRPELRARVEALNVRTTTFVMPSGLNVVLQQDTSTPNISVTTLFGGGRARDTQGGASHVLEHLTYHTDVEGIPAKARLQAAGASFDAVTATDWATFSVLAPASALGEVLAVQTQRIADPMNGITDTHIEVEKATTAMEPYFRHVGGMQRAWPTIYRGLFGEDHPEYGPMASEFLLDADQVTREQIEAYAEEIFRPDNATLVVLGDFEFDEAIATIMGRMHPKAIHADATDDNRITVFKPGVVNADWDNPEHTMTWFKLPGEDGPMTLPDTEPQPRLVDFTVPEKPLGPPTKYVTVPGLVNTPIAVVAYAVPGLFNGEDHLPPIGAAANLRNEAWAGVWAVQENTEMGAPMVGCSAAPGLYSTIVLCQAVARDNNVDPIDLVDRLMSMSSIFANPDLIQSHETAAFNGRDTALRDVVKSFDLHRLRAETLALHTHYTGDPSYNVELMNRVMTVDRTDVPPWVSTWLPEARAVSVIVVPRDQDEWLSIASSSAYHGDLIPVPMATPETAPTNEEIDATMSIPDLSKVTTFTTENGLKVVMLNHGDAPVVRSTLVSRGGSAYGNGLDDYSDLMVRRLMNDIYTSQAKSDLMPLRIAGGIDNVRGTHLTYESMWGPAENLDGTLYLLRRNDAVRAYNPTAKNRWWRNTRVALPVAWANRGWWAQKTRLDHLYEGHPAVYTMTKEDALLLKDVSGAELSAYYGQKFSPENSTLYVVGKIKDEETARSDVERFWGNWKGGAGEPLGDLPPPPAPKGSKVFLFDAPSLEQTLISAACPLAEPTGENYSSQQVLGALLREALAETLATEGVNSYASDGSYRFVAPLAWVQGFAVVDNAQASNALSTIQNTFKQLAAGEVDPTRMQQHKLRLAGQFSVAHQSNAGTINVLAEADLLPGRGEGWLEAHRNALANVSAETIQAAAGACAENLVVTVEGPVSQLGDQVSGWDAEVVDWVQLGDDELMVFDKGAYKRMMKRRAKAAK